MSKALITEGYLTDIANAIRAKNGSADTYTPPQMAAAIADIPTGSDVDVEPLSVVANGTYTAPSGKAYSPVTALVPNTYGSGDEGKVVQNGALVAQTSRTLTQNGTYDTTANDSVTVNVSGGITPVPIYPPVYAASFIGQDSNLQVNSSIYTDFCIIAIDLLQYAGKIIRIINTGNRNYYGLYANIRNGENIKLFTNRQSTDGELIIFADDYMAYGRYLVYDYTSSSQAAPEVSTLDINI